MRHTRSAAAIPTITTVNTQTDRGARRAGSDRDSCQAPARSQVVPASHVHVAVHGSRPRALPTAAAIISSQPGVRWVSR